MVFFFDVGDNTATGRAGYIVYMGENSDENDVLIEWCAPRFCRRQCQPPLASSRCPQKFR